MTFLFPSDPGYRRAKQARRGGVRPDPRFEGFLARFRGRFRVDPLWLELDHVDWGGPFPKPRLDVVLERTKQYRSFLTRSGSYDTRKQRAVAAVFAEELAGVDLRPMFGLPRQAHGLGADDIFVCFSQFEQPAKDEAHQLVTGEEVARFEALLDLGDAFWQTRSFCGPPIVFVHTEQQAEELRNAPVRDHWADDYFALLRPHDEFGYIDRADIAIHVDSKENFDQHYESNWYYYFK